MGIKIATSKDDVQDEIDGVWIEYQEEDCKLLIARMGNPKNRKAYERAQAKYKSRGRRKDLTPDQNIEVLARCLSESILLDWEGIMDMQGKALEYSREAAYQALRWDLDLRLFVSEQADISENFRAEEVEKTGKK
jgi:hypothetical protein